MNEQDSRFDARKIKEAGWLRTFWFIASLVLPGTTGVPARASLSPAPFTYQGRLHENGNPAAGHYDF